MLNAGISKIGKSVAVAKKADRTAYDVRYIAAEPNRRFITVQ